MKKVLNVILSAIILVLVITGCGEKQVSNDKMYYSVEVMEVSKQSRTALLDYVGIVDSSQIKQYAFKSPGKVQSIHVKKGEKISKGQLLVTLDSKDLQFDLSAAEAQKNAARLQYEKVKRGLRTEELEIEGLNVSKAEAAYKHALDYHDRIKELYETGAVSRSEYDQVKTDLDIKKAEFEQKKRQERIAAKGSREEDTKALYEEYKKAEADYSYKEKLLKDAAIISDVDGYVADITVKEGELVAEGSPVVMVRDEVTSVKVGITQKDSIRIKAGLKADADISGLKFTGTVTSVSAVPQDDNMSYEVKVALDKKQDVNSLGVGATAKVAFRVGEEEGIWIPVNTILNDGEDYVFVMEEERAVRKNIIVEYIYGNHAKVHGVTEKQILITKGMINLKEGYNVAVKK